MMAYHRKWRKPPANGGLVPNGVSRHRCRCCSAEFGSHSELAAHLRQSRGCVMSGGADSNGNHLQQCGGLERNGEVDVHPLPPFECVQENAAQQKGNGPKSRRGGNGNNGGGNGNFSTNGGGKGGNGGNKGHDNGSGRQRNKSNGQDEHLPQQLFSQPPQTLPPSHGMHPQDVSMSQNGQVSRLNSDAGQTQIGADTTEYMRDYSQTMPPWQYMQPGQPLHGMPTQPNNIGSLEMQQAQVQAAQGQAQVQAGQSGCPPASWNLLAWSLFCQMRAAQEGVQPNTEGSLEMYDVGGCGGQGMPQGSYSFEMTLTRAPDEELGLDVEVGAGGLEVNAVLPGGAVVKQQSPHSPNHLEPGDRIVEVNSVKDAPSMLSVIRRGSLLHMTVLRGAGRAQGPHRGNVIAQAQEEAFQRRALQGAQQQENTNASIAPTTPQAQQERPRRRCEWCGWQGLGAFDLVSRRWYCAPCGDRVLDSYRDQQLAEDIRFLRSYAVRSPDEPHSHSSFLGFHDPTCFVGKFNFPVGDKNVMQCYGETVTRFYRRGMHLMHMEHLGTGPRKYCEDIDVQCTTGRPDCEEVLQNDFISLRMAMLADVFPDVDLLVYVYRSSGHSKKYCAYKVSAHFVYNVVVDEERAAVLRQHCIESLNFLSGNEANKGTMAESVAKRVYKANLELSEVNQWNIVFDSAVTVGTNGLRVPLNDKRDRPKGTEKLPPENRPKEPAGVWSFDHATRRAVQVKTRRDLPDTEWVRLGLCSCTPDTTLTAWRQPELAEPLQAHRQRVRVAGSTTVSARRRNGNGGGNQVVDPRRKREAPPARVVEQKLYTQPWEEPPAPVGENEFILIWHDGSHCDHGISGATTVSLIVPKAQATHSRIIFANHAYWAGQLTPQCAEYLGLLLGLQVVSEHPGCLNGRRLVIWGDSQPIQHHLRDNRPPNADCGQLIPLVDEARVLLQAIEGRCVGQVEIRAVEHTRVGVEDRRARAALRNCEPTLDVEANPGTAAALRKAEAVWASRTNRVPCSETIMLLLDTKTDTGDLPDAGSSEGHASDTPVTSGPGTGAALVRLRRYGRFKEVWVSRHTTLGELARAYGGEQGWEVRENSNSPALFAGLRVADLVPTNESGSSEEALNLELFQDDLWHSEPGVQANNQELMPQPQQPPVKRTGRMGKAGRRAAPNNGDVTEVGQHLHGSSTVGGRLPSGNIANGNVANGTLNGHNANNHANSHLPNNGNGSGTGGQCSNGGGNGNDNGHNNGYSNGHNGNRSRGHRRGGNGNGSGNGGVSEVGAGYMQP